MGEKVELPAGFQILITLDPAGGIKVEGAITDKILALGMLEVAKETICQFHAERNSRQKIQPVAPGTMLKPVKIK